MHVKRCIFHYPNPIVEKPGIGSALRPNKMREAFEKAGYIVEDATGYGAERRQKICEIKKKIRSGVQYDFVYSESVNSPTLLTEEDHIPRHPFLDFSFFRFCRKNGIPVGLFYRDCHWKFPVYKSVSRWKRCILIPLFRYDLHMYRKTVDMLFLPSLRIAEIFPDYCCAELPPGGILQKNVLKTRKNRTIREGTLNIFYVGNVMGVYDIRDFCRAVAETENVFLTICTPRESWEERKDQYVISDRIRVVHKAAHELGEYYENADVFACCLQPNEYTRLAMPIKVPEAIGYGLPVMITEGIAAAETIEKEGCGWVMENSVAGMKTLLEKLKTHPEEIREKTENVLAAAPRHTWESRARSAAKVLVNLKNKGE